MTSPEDGFLPAALRRLGNMVADLIDPLPQLIDGKLHYSNSRYRQLGQAVYGQRAVRGNGQSSIPIWTDAFDLLREIDVDVVGWFAAEDRPRTETRLVAMLESPWRPQDVSVMDAHADDLARWAQRIDGLMSETHVMELDAPCPACQARTVQRMRAGELVRVAALQVDVNGCRCLNPECETEWLPQYFRQLALVIGCPPPAGILE